MSYFKDIFAKKIQLIHSFTESKWDTPTPIELVSIMCENIHTLVNSKTTKYLDPSCGRGTFLVKLYELQFTKTFSHIKSIETRNKMVIDTLYGYELNSYYHKIAIESIKQIQKYFEVTNILNPHIYNSNYLNTKKLNNMEFNVKLGNPPYQDTNKAGGIQPKSHNLWGKFIIESFTSTNAQLANNGYVTFVTPSSWGSPSNSVLKLFKENNLILVDTTISHHFKENSTFSYWIVQKANYKGVTNINGIDFNLSNLNYLQSDINEISTKIHKIFNESNHPKLAWKTDTTTNHSSKKSDIWNESITNKHQYNVYHTNAQSYFSKVKSKSHDFKKVFLTISGYFNPIYDRGTCSTSEVVPYIIVESDQIGKNLLSILNSKLFKYIVSSAKWSGFINKDILRILPNIGTHKKWSDDDIYALFKLSNKEINYIENYVK